MSDTGALRVRQWVSMPGGSFDARLGTEVIDECAAVLKGAVGRPRASALVAADDVSDELVERLRRQLTDAGFSVGAHRVPAGPAARSLETSGALFAWLAAEHLTSDDLMVCVGDVDVLSLASYACAQWCTGMPLVMVPTSQLGLVEAPLTPRGMDVPGFDRALTVRPCVKHVLFDTDLTLGGVTDEDALMTRVLMVVTAMCDAESSVSRLWDRTEGICAGDREVIVEQLRDTLKTRGKALSSTALALRQSLAYGEAFARALVRLTDGTVAPSTARAEALRFQLQQDVFRGDGAVDLGELRHVKPFLPIGDDNRRRRVPDRTGIRRGAAEFLQHVFVRDDEELPGLLVLGRRRGKSRPQHLVDLLLFHRLRRKMPNADARENSIHFFSSFFVFHGKIFCRQFPLKPYRLCGDAVTLQPTTAAESAAAPSMAFAHRRELLPS